ncbi:MAG: sulfur oxidation c-type cytochrome SoxX [Gammaproteobacteria bacterium]|nr:sulfur oxidation c-type cytochrome SoxX [Gammaproteobacteria bacterium]MBI5616852.1 sulfur oxidation c-type cytochrome SoxX [Gammaproteobacteria bacterium]
MRNDAAAEARRPADSVGRGAALALLAVLPLVSHAEAAASGRAIALAPDKGSCVSCHALAGADQAGDVGPGLADMRRRFPDPAVLRARIRDARDFNPDTLMPPYGRHRILKDEEIEALVQFLYTL